MAEKRMFTKKITNADAFTALPPTTQALYFHLCMNADDDGFNNQIRQSMFNAHADTNDFNLLIQKRFIIPFDDKGVIVIKHWKMHNYIQNDRYHATEYVEEKSKLLLKKNGVYTENSGSESEMYTECIQDGYNMDTQIRLDKNRLDKNRLDKNNKAQAPKEYFHYEPLDNVFNEFIEMRKKMRKPMTAHAVDLAISKIQKLSNADKDVAVDIVNQSIEHGWTSFYPLESNKNQKGGQALDDFYTMAKEWADERGNNET